MEFVQDRITTLHAVADEPPGTRLARVAVVVPMMGADLDAPRPRTICDALAEVNPGHVVLSVRGDRERVDVLARTMASHDLDVTLLWCNAPTIEYLLGRHGIASVSGKGLDVWLGMALVAADHDIVVVQDADARPYDPGDVSRLAWPIERGYAFSKGYYARIERDRLFGRLVRLLWFPLMAALTADRSNPFLRYLDALRYPLAGEFAMRAADVSSMQLYPRWGLETGMLCDMYDVAGVSGTAQVDLGVHRHDHRPVTGADGLAAMADEVVGTLLGELADRGVAVRPDVLASAYENTAASFVDRYAADAAYNGLRFDPEHERDQIDTYREVIGDGGTITDRLPALDALALDASEIRTAGVIDEPSTEARGVQ